MSYNQRCGKMNKSESKPVEKALPANQLLQLLEVEIGNFNTKLQGMFAPAEKIKRLTRKVEMRVNKRTREDRRWLALYTVMSGLKEHASDMEDALKRVEGNSRNVENIVGHMKTQDRKLRSGRYR